MGEHQGVIQEVVQVCEGLASQEKQSTDLPKLLGHNDKDTLQRGSKTMVEDEHANRLETVSGEANEELKVSGQAVKGLLPTHRKVTVQDPLRFIAAHDADIPESVRAAFEAFDSDRSGALDYKELRNALRLYGIDVSAAAAASVLSAYDDHPDGSLELTEFARLVRDAEAGGVYAAKAPESAAHEPVELPAEAIAEPAKRSLEIIFDDNGVERKIKIFKKPLGAQFSKWWFGRARISKVSKRSYAEGLGLHVGWQVKAVAGEDMTKKNLKEIQAAILNGLEPLQLVHCHGMTNRSLHGGMTNRSLRALTHRSFRSRKA